jgi:ADP-ribosylglycohydrolase
MAKGLLDGLAPQEAYRFMIDQGQRYYNMVPFHNEYPHFARMLSGALSDLPEAEIASSGYVVHTLEASIWCLLMTTSFEKAVLTAVNLGDDTDTTGCVAGGLAGVYYRFSSMPVLWHDGLVRWQEIEPLLQEYTLTVR